MADELNEETPGEGHNGAPLTDDEKKQAIKSLAAELAPLKEEKAAVQAQITKKWREFKAQTGLNRKEVEAAIKYAEFMEPDERKARLSDFAIAMQALAPGETLDMFRDAA